MASIAEQYLSPIKTLIKSREYREFARLLLKYKDFPRSKNTSLRFMNYEFETVDALSFIFQIKHIFVNSLYRFETKAKRPLIYDCGANVGLSCLYFKKAFPKCKIKAFEADPNITKVLRKNIARNKLANVDIFNTALWINKKGITFIPDNADGGSIFGESKKIKVDSTRLRDLIKKEKKIDLIKLNVEGAEVELIKDCHDILHKTKNMIIEYHSYPDKRQELDKILSILTKNGFKYYIQNVNTSRMTPPKSELRASEFDLQLHIFAYKI
ncbi:MAG: hypothetical protein A2V66_06135 [Ignavibacteria bacterium RBG_13_36_8]|nr:MAG: hypothetical protein A2V66_06135 [Ignavibacteria bacterium RBG_13_36_8]